MAVEEHVIKQEKRLKPKEQSEVEKQGGRGTTHIWVKKDMLEDPPEVPLHSGAARSVNSQRDRLQGFAGGGRREWVCV